MYLLVCCVCPGISLLLYNLVRYVPVIIDEEEQWRLVHMSLEGVSTTVEVKAMSGHFGRDKTVFLLTSKVYFPGITNKVKQFVNSYEACQHVKAGSKFEKGGDELKSMHVPLETWSQLGIDLITNLPVTPEGYNTMVTCIDYTSKFIESKPLIGKCVEGVAQFMYELVCHYGAARIHISDQGREFVNQVCVNSCAFRVNTCILCSVHPRIIHKLYFMYAQEFFITFTSCTPKNFFRVCPRIAIYFLVCEKFYEITNIRHNITSAYHPQANGEVERFNRITQEAFLETQEFHDRVAQENTDWAKKLQSILFAYRIHKQASTHFSPFYMLYGREPLIPWQMENDLGPLDMFQGLPDFTIEETIEKMENLHQQVLEVAAGNIKKAQAHQAKTYNAKHARNDFEVGTKVWKKTPLWNTKQKSMKKGPMWRGPYEVEGKTPAGN